VISHAATHEFLQISIPSIQGLPAHAGWTHCLFGHTENLSKSKLEEVPNTKN